MSSRRPLAAKNDGNKEEITLIVLRSSGGKDEFRISLSHTLQELKTVISESEPLGQIAVGDQRLFHLGRELKTPGRTLESLGVTRFGVHVLHVHSVRPTKQAPAEDNNNSDDDDVVEVIEISLDESGGSNYDDEVVEVLPNPSQQQKQVIDLASDPSDDDNEEESQPAPAANRRKRQRVT